MKTPLQEGKFTVWCGFTKSTVVVPFFFQKMCDYSFIIVSVMDERYADVLQNGIFLSVDEKHLLESTIFTQVDSPPQNVRCLNHLLRIFLLLIAC